MTGSHLLSSNFQPKKYLVIETGAGPLCRYFKPLLGSWLSLQFAIGQIVLVEVSRTELASF